MSYLGSTEIAIISGFIAGIIIFIKECKTTFSKPGKADPPAGLIDPIQHIQHIDDTIKALRYKQHSLKEKALAIQAEADITIDFASGKWEYKYTPVKRASMLAQVDTILVQVEKINLQIDRLQKQKVKL